MAFGTAVLGLVTAGQAQAPRVLADRPPVPGAPAGVTAFVDVNVIPMDTARVLPHQTVLIRGGRIAALGPVATTPVPKGAGRIAGRGQYLLPGFGACHTHLTSILVPPIPGDGPAEVARETQLNLFLLFDKGITVARNMDYRTVDADGAAADGQPWSFGLGRVRGADLLRLRAQANGGTLWSPRLYLAGQWAPTQYTEPSWGLRQHSATRVWPAPRLDSVAAYVAAYQRAGYDFIKLHDEPTEIAESVLVAAQRVGIQVGGHLLVPFEHALAGKQVTDHSGAGGWPGLSMDPRDSAENRALRARLAAQAGARRRAGAWGCIGEYFAHDSVAMLILRIAMDSGAGMLLGDDGGMGSFALPEYVHEAHLTPYEALALGTKHFGQYLRTFDPVHGAETGTIGVGQRADLVLLTGNPLQDIRAANPWDQLGEHPSYFTPHPNPALVMVGGRWLARPELDRRLAVLGRYRTLVTALSGLYGGHTLRPDSVVRAAVIRFERQYRAPQFALLDRFVLTRAVPAGGADSLRGTALVVALAAQQLGAVRAALPAAAQARFDERARAWLAARAAEGDRVTIAGVHP